MAQGATGVKVHHLSIPRTAPFRPFHTPFRIRILRRNAEQSTRRLLNSVTTVEALRDLNFGAGGKRIGGASGNADEGAVALEFNRGGRIHGLITNKSSSFAGETPGV